MANKKDNVETRINDKYIVGAKLGSGSFGDIFLATNNENGEIVAIKMEDSKSKHPQLLMESKIMKQIQNGVGIPQMHWFGMEAGLNILVMDLLGPTLEDLFILCQKKFSLKTTLLLADQLISRIEFFH